MQRLEFLTTPWHPLSTMTPDEQTREAARLDYETLMADAADRLKHQVDLGKVMIQSLTFVNGGAIVALFTLIGKQGGELALDPGAIKTAFAFFIAGLVSVLISSFSGFGSQFYYALTSTIEAWNKQDVMLGAESRNRDFTGPFRRGNIALVICLASAAVSLLCFALGSWSALSGVLDKSTTIVPLM